MNLSDEELLKEKKYLEGTIGEIRNQISTLAEDLYDDEEKQKEFRTFMWDSRQELDETEMRQMRAQTEAEAVQLGKKLNYFKKLYKIQNNPYFGKITFMEDGDKIRDYYIGITYLTKDNENLINDWRSPISSIFYDFESGPCEYETPSGMIHGTLYNKRQFTIEEGKLKRVFDNKLNIQDELLQEVLATKASDKMKNIVNTIQAEQNAIIRNTKDRNLIVQGIAGSGKTSVALHRVAFLLYKIKNLTSDKVLIFAPNNIFSEYISNVLPELGEDNTKETTFHEFLTSYIKEYKYIEDFTSFIERYYKHNEIDPELVKFKQSDEIAKPIIEYVKRYTNVASFNEDIMTRDLYYSKDDLNFMLHHRYQKFPLVKRLEAMAEKICEQKFKGSKAKEKTVYKLLRENLNVTLDIKLIYKSFYKSKEFKESFKKEINPKYITRLSDDTISYEDAICFVFMKCLLCGFIYDYEIEQTIIDEAQDYNKLQYILMKRILRKSKFTILGDINQTINPYYQYKSLEELKGLFKDDCNYLELTKTYRSSPEIIEHTNKILDLNLVSAIRRDNHIPVEFRKEDNLKEQLINDINDLRYENSSIAIITKTDEEAEKIYDIIHNDYKDMKLITNKSKTFSRGLVVIPSYIAKGLEFDATIIYTDKNNPYEYSERFLYYVACTRSQHHLIIYNQKKLV